MAITLTTTVQRVETYPAMTPAPEGEETFTTMMVVYNDLFDDADDDQLPVIASKVLHFSKGDDMSGQDELVKTIATAIWS